MVALTHGATFILVFTISFLFTSADARRRYDHRREIGDSFPIAQSGWMVPLDGGKTCEDSSRCISALNDPPITSTLEYLAIGKGTITYSCADRAGNEQPYYVGQNTFLYDVADLVPKFSSEEQFHSYIPRFLEYDYTSLDNSSLTCIGNIQDIDHFIAFTLYNIDAYTVVMREEVNSPDNRQYDLHWARMEASDAKWDIYRVETAGGGPPYDCGDQIINKEIPVEYVAEYWFYRRGGSPPEGVEE